MQPIVDWLEATFGLSQDVSQAIVIGLASALAALVIDVLIRRGVKVLARKSETDLDDEIIDLAHRPIFFTVLLIGVNYALSDLLPEYEEGAVLTHTNAIETAIVLLWAWLAVRIVGKILDRMAEYSGRFDIVQEGTAPLLTNLFKLAVLGGVLYFMIGVWEVGALEMQLDLAKEYRALIIFLVFLAGALLADHVVRRILTQMAGHTRTDLDDRVIEIAHKPIFMTVLLIGFKQALDELIPGGQVHSNIIKTLIVVVWVVLTVRILTLVLERMSASDFRYKIVQPATLPIFTIGMKVIVVGGSVYFVLIAWGVDPAGWVASAGIVGITIGFAARDTIANLFAGIFILADAPYKIGDYIVLDTGDRGKVTKIGIRSTRVLTRDDVEITIPNAVIADAKIVNQSGGPWPKFRVRISVGVAYGSDVDRVRELLMEIATTDKEVCGEPNPRLRFREFGDSSLNFQLLCWVEDPELRGRVTDRLLANIYKTLDREGIEIPFPQRDIHVRDWDEGSESRRVQESKSRGVEN